VASVRLSATALAAMSAPAMVEVEWLSDNGSPYTAHEIRRLAQEIGTTPIESPQSNGMAEAF